MSEVGTLIRRVARASGFLALFGVVLFAVVGLVMLRSAGAPPHPTLTAPVAAGAAGQAGVRTLAVWGAGVTDPDAVTCTWLTPEQVPATLDLADEHLTADDPTLGVVTLVGTIYAPTARDVTCTGGGMTSFAFANHQSGPPSSAVGIGFLVGAGVAALWAALMLTTTRPRHPARR
ncbi:hypothetical protein [Cellulomonas sp.]|uniref:hypothetical protein n=1 Tax=Cellulomonas sp. TaxID=40001 RepID=UPI003BAD6782